MFKRILIHVLPVLFILMIVSCIFPPEDDYVELKLVDYFTLSHESMAKKLARQLDVMPISYNGTTYFSFMGDDNHLTPYTGHQWIKEGHEYITSDSALIIVWTDSLDQPYQVQYLLARLGSAPGWTGDQNEVDKKITGILKNLGIDVTKNAAYISRAYAAGIPNGYWYNIEARQVFQTDTIAYPWIQAEAEGDNLKINFMQIRRWYKNLDRIEYTLSDSSLKAIALDYYTQSEEVISIPANLEILNTSIIHNKLCKVLGYGIVDQWGSYILIYIDVQNGSIVDTEYIYYR